MKLFAIALAMLFTGSISFADCQGIQVPWTIKGKDKALVCKDASYIDVTMCFENGVEAAAQQSIEDSKPAVGMARIGGSDTNISIQFKRFGFEPGMYEGTTTQDVNIHGSPASVFVSIDAWGPDHFKVTSPEGGLLAQGSCKLVTADESTVSLTQADGIGAEE